MKALTLAVQLILVVTILVGGFSCWVDFIRDRRIKKYEASEKRIPILWAQGTLRRKER